MNKIYLAIIGIVAVLGMGVMFLADDSSAEDIDPQADERTVVQTFNIGVDGSDNVVATLYDDGELVITGDGEETKSYGTSASNGPFVNIRENITKITFNAPNLKILGSSLFGSAYTDRVLTNLITIDWGISPIEEFKSRVWQMVTPNTYLEKLPDTIRIIDQCGLSATFPEHLKIPDNCELITSKGLANIQGVKIVELSQKCANGTTLSSVYSATWGYSFPSSIETVIINGTGMDVTWTYPGELANRYNYQVQYMPNVSKIVLHDVFKLTTYWAYNLSSIDSKVEYDVDGNVFGWYADSNYTIPRNLADSGDKYLMVAKANVDPAYNVDDESFNFENVSATMNVSGTDYDLVPEYAIYPTDYTTGSDSGMAGKLLKTIPVFVALALLMGIVVAVRSRMD